MPEMYPVTLESGQLARAASWTFNWVKSHKRESAGLVAATAFLSLLHTQASPTEAEQLYGAHYIAQGDCLQGNKYDPAMGALVSTDGDKLTVAPNNASKPLLQFVLKHETIIDTRVDVLEPTASTNTLLTSMGCTSLATAPGQN